MSERGVRLWPITLTAVSFGVGAAVASAHLASVTPDEPIHLEWSRRLLDSRVTERRSNEYFESKSPITMLNVAARRFARHELGATDSRTLLLWARLPTIGLFVALLGAVFLVARAWVGRGAAHLATIACALDPNLIAHSALVTVDVPYALFHFLTLAAAYSFVRRPSLGRSVPLGLAAGAAFSTKFTAALLIPGVALGLLARRAAPSFSPGRLLKTTAFLAFAATLAILVVCAAYLFTGVGAPLSSMTWDSRPMLLMGRALPRLRLPLPADFLTGFDLSLARERNLEWRVVMFGQRHPRGVWYYFLVLWLMKTPLLILAAQVVGYVRAARRGLLWRDAAVRFLALNLLLFLGYLSFLFHAQIGYRFALACVPLGYIVAAAGLASLPSTPAVLTAAIVALLTAVGENAAYLGNHLAFTNLAVQPKRHVFRWITHSNVDWRQNEDKADSYLARAGIGPARLDPPHILPGLNLLRHYHAAGNLRFERYRWVRENVDPVAHFDHTFLLFDISEAQFERFLEQGRRVPSSPRAAALCPPDEGGDPVGKDVVVRLLERQEAIVCVSTSGGADLVMRSTAGSLLFGSATGSSGDRDFLETGQEAWYRLPPGVHAFRASPRTPFTGTLGIARGSALVSVKVSRNDPRVGGR